MSVQAASQGNEICKLLPLTFTATGETLAAVGSVANAYSSMFGRPSLSKSVVMAVMPVAISALVNLPACHVEYGELIVRVKFAVVDWLSALLT